MNKNIGVVAQKHVTRSQACVVVFGHADNGLKLERQSKNAGCDVDLVFSQSANPGPDGVKPALSLVDALDYPGIRRRDTVVNYPRNLGFDFAKCH